MISLAVFSARKAPVPGGMTVDANEPLIIDAPSRIISDGDPGFRDQFNRNSFGLTHELSEHPLLALPRLLQLAQTMAKEDVYYDAGDFQIGQRWDTRQPCDLSAAQLLERIENAGAWIILRNVHKYDEYNHLVNQCLDECFGFVDNSLRKRIQQRVGIIFVTSPNRIATYHIDRECSVLFQIRGKKELSVFDKHDREVLPEEELERFWTVDNNAAIYKEQYQDRAAIYKLRPGMAVHIPVNAPHWVKNDDNVSISLNVNFHFNERLDGEHLPCELLPAQARHRARAPRTFQDPRHGEGSSHVVRARILSESESSASEDVLNLVRVEPDHPADGPTGHRDFRAIVPTIGKSFPACALAVNDFAEGVLDTLGDGNDQLHGSGLRDFEPGCRSMIGRLEPEPAHAIIERPHPAQGTRGLGFKDP